MLELPPLNIKLPPCGACGHIGKRCSRTLLPGDTTHPIYGHLCNTHSCPGSNHTQLPETGFTQRMRPVNICRLDKLISLK